MDFAFTPQQEALRREVRAFLAEEMTPEVIAEMEAHNEGRPFHRTACRTPLLSALFQKIGVRDRTQAVLYAISNGIVAPPTDVASRG